MRITAVFLSAFFLLSCNRENRKEVHIENTVDTIVHTPETVSKNDSPAVETDPVQTIDPAAAAQQSMRSAADTLKTDANYRVMVFKNNGQDGLNGYGYDLFRDNKIIVRQPHIPAIPGNHGFATPAEAERTGQLMLRKIKQGIMPPTVSVEELDSMGISR